jgi:hypothetical protein
MGTKGVRKAVDGPGAVQSQGVPDCVQQNCVIPSLSTKIFQSQNWNDESKQRLHHYVVTIKTTICYI